MTASDLLSESDRFALLELGIEARRDGLRMTRRLAPEQLLHAACIVDCAIATRIPAAMTGCMAAMTAAADDLAEVYAQASLCDCQAEPRAVFAALERGLDAWRLCCEHIRGLQRYGARVTAQARRIGGR